VSVPVQEPHLVRSVLLVDNNVDHEETLSMLPQSADCSVFTVYCGPDALHIGAECNPEVAILDLGLPGMSGYELCRLRLFRQ
jgi:CheY-like chemotaxis protein